MFPQYSAATTASIFDKLSEELSKWRNIPDIRFLSTYHDHIFILMRVQTK